MAGYRRFVSYIYEYPNGKKEENKGFVKIDCRNGSCRLQMQMQGLEADEMIQIGGFARKDGGITKIPFGNGKVENQIVEYRMSTPEDHMGGSSFSLEQLAGMFFEGSSGSMFVTAWDEEPVRAEDFLEGNRVEEILEESPKEEVESIVEAMEEIQEEAQEEPPQEQPQEKAVHMTQAAAPNRQQPQMGFSRGGNTCLARKWEQFQCHYSHLEPFEDDELIECIQIAPKDIMFLRREDWNLGKNTFLMQGFYNYHHLLLGRVKKGGFVMGVPGTMENQERFMAGMFGFPDFKEVPQKEGQRQQGYWLRPVG